MGSERNADHRGSSKPDLPSEEKEPLPEGWKLKISKSTGQKYYENKKLKLTQWDPPVEKGLEKAKDKLEEDPPVAKQKRKSREEIEEDPPVEKQKRKSKEEIKEDPPVEKGLQKSKDK